MLEVRGVTKIFNAGTPNEVRSLQGVDLNLDEGEFVIIIGTNGSGKSTLLNAVAGTFLVDSGAIRLAGQDVTRWPEHRRARLIGRVFQNPFSGTAKPGGSRNALSSVRAKGGETRSWTTNTSPSANGARSTWPKSRGRSATPMPMVASTSWAAAR